MKKVLETVPKKALSVPERPVDHPYAATDPIPVPEALESDSDTTWALFEDSIAPEDAQADRSFANTVPDELPTQPAALRSRD
jgi:hypothetical protein